jgi:hypothetical protein
MATHRVISRRRHAASEDSAGHALPVSAVRRCLILSRASVSINRVEVNCVPLSVVSVKFASRLPAGSRWSTACSTAASASSVWQRRERSSVTFVHSDLATPEIHRDSPALKRFS